MNFYLNALQDEHRQLENALPGYRNQITEAAKTISEYLKRKKANKIIFAAMGSSLYAARSIISKLGNNGIFAVAENCYELLKYRPEMIDKETIMVLISQSGNTPEICELNEVCRLRAAWTVAVLNEPDCRMRGKADAEIMLNMCSETPISNKTYYGQVALLNLLAEELTFGDYTGMEEKIKKAIVWHEEFVHCQKELTQPILDFMEDADFIDILGDDSQGGAALQTGLVWREMLDQDVAYYSLSDYSHGWFDIARKHYLMIILTDRITEMDRRVIAHCHKHDGKVLILSKEDEKMISENMMYYPLPAVENSLLPLYSIVPMYFVAGIIPEKEGGHECTF